MPNVTNSNVSNPCPVVHFEMPYENETRMKRFYDAAFGCGMNGLGEKMGHYVLATTSAGDQQGPLERGRINGGFFPKNPDWPAQYPNIVIAVENLRSAMATVNAAGGKTLGEPMLIPGVGDYVSFLDTEGNRVSMLQPLPRDATQSCPHKT